MPGYELIASPSLYSGQTVRARLSADPNNTKAMPVNLFIDVYGPDDTPVSVQGPSVTFVSWLQSGDCLAGAANGWSHSSDRF